MTEHSADHINPVLVELTKKMISSLIILWPPEITHEISQIFQQQKLVLFQGLEEQGIDLSEEEVMEYVRARLSDEYKRAQVEYYKPAESEESLTVIQINPRS